MLKFTGPLSMMLGVCVLVGCTQEPISRASTIPEFTTTQYQASSDTFPNPERGFYIQRRFDPKDMPNFLDLEDLKSARSRGMSMIRMYYVLSDYRNRPLDYVILDRIEQDFQTIRKSGLKVIPRFAYNFGPIGMPDAPQRVAMKHIDQVAPIIQKNSDIIAFFEAGFVGTWGEWHHSTNGLISRKPDDLEELNPRTKTLLNRLMAIVPSDRMIAVRAPRYKQQMFGPQPLSAKEAFSRSPKARLAQHNDCFLASKDNWTTFFAKTDASLDQEKAYLSQDNLFVPQGGETCNAAADAKPYIQCDFAVPEMARLRYSTLNADFDENVLKLWRNGDAKGKTCYREIEQKMGYRFRAVSLTAPKALRPGSELNLQLQIANEGWANLYNPRTVEIWLRHRNSQTIAQFQLSEDPRFWNTGKTRTIQVRANLPSNLPDGEYEILLGLRDPKPDLRDRAEYAIRLANPDVWDEETGFNRLARIQINQNGPMAAATGNATFMVRNSGQ